MNDQKKYRYSEIFGDTIQGEGHYTGVPTVWVRWWGCNFNCNGFSQKNPLDPSTYELHYDTINVEDYTDINQLPVFKTGCDSSYSWAKKFAHLAKQETAVEICDNLEKWLRTETNPNGKFKHARSKQHTHLAFTGGEPMMNQSAIVDVLEEFNHRDNFPRYITIETNGTQAIRDPFKLLFLDKSKDWSDNKKNIELFWSCSPKLSTSGESWDDAIKPEIVEKYNNLSSTGQLKFVCDGTPEAWDEIEKATKMYREVGVEWPVWIMPLGARREQHETDNFQAIMCEETVRRGYNFAPRVHCWVFGNAVGK